MGARPPQLDGDRIAAELEVLSRAPFQELLVDLLEARPSPEAIKEFAARHPDRWAQATVMLARLAGYNDKVKVDGSLAVQVSLMSDVELLDQLAELETLPRTDTGQPGIRRSRGYVFSS